MVQNLNLGSRDKVVSVSRKINCITAVPQTLTKHQGKSSQLQTVTQYFLLTIIEKKKNVLKCFLEINQREYFLLLDVGQWYQPGLRHISWVDMRRSHVMEEWLQ